MAQIAARFRLRLICLCLSLHVVRTLQRQRVKVRHTTMINCCARERYIIWSCSSSSGVKNIHHRSTVRGRSGKSTHCQWLSDSWTRDHVSLTANTRPAADADARHHSVHHRHPFIASPHSSLYNAIVPTCRKKITCSIFVISLYDRPKSFFIGYSCPSSRTHEESQLMRTAVA